MMTYKKQAFSLVELIVAVVIIGVLTALAIPRIQHVQNKAKFNVIKANGKIIGKALAQLQSLGVDADKDGIFEPIELVDLTRIDGVFVQMVHDHTGLQSQLSSIEPNIDIFLESDTDILDLDSDQYFAITNGEAYDTENNDGSRDPDIFYFNLNGGYIGDAGNAPLAVAAIPGNTAVSNLKSAEINVISDKEEETSAHTLAKL